MTPRETRAAWKRGRRARGRDPPSRGCVEVGSAEQRPGTSRERAEQRPGGEHLEVADVAAAGEVGLGGPGADDDAGQSEAAVGERLQRERRRVQRPESGGGDDRAPPRRRLRPDRRAVAPSSSKRTSKPPAPSITTSRWRLPQFSHFGGERAEVHRRPPADPGRRRRRERIRVARPFDERQRGTRVDRRAGRSRQDRPARRRRLRSAPP